MSSGESRPVSIHRRQGPPLYRCGSSKSSGFPVGIQDQIDHGQFLLHFHLQRHAARLRAPIRLSLFHPVPGFVGLLNQLRQAQTLMFMLHAPQEPSLVEQRHKAMDIRVFGHQGPVEPTEFIVMTIGIVVAVPVSAALHRP